MIVASLVSPLFLKIAEFIFQRSNAKAKKEAERLSALFKRVDELKEANIKQSVRIQLLEVQLNEKQSQIQMLRQQVAELQKENADLRAQIRTMQEERNAT